MAFNSSTAAICRELGIVAGRTLLRRRKGTKSSPPCPPDQQFFEFGVHWIFRSPGSPNFLWDREKTIERVVGICPRTAGELSRSLNRWGQFLGLQDTPAEVTQHTLIQLSAPSDGAAFGEKWSQQPVEIEATGPATGPTAQLPSAESSHTLNEALLTKQFEANQGAA